MKHHLLRYGLPLLSFFFLGATISQAQTNPTQVTGFRNNPGHSGYTPATLTTPLSLLWRYTTTAAPDSPASPILANGIVYFGGGEHVYAVRAADGSLVWEYPDSTVTTSSFDSTPALAQGALYIGSEDGSLDKLDAKTGALIWSQKVGGAIRGAPAVQDGVVYFGSADNHCYAASTDTGNIQWSYLTDGAITSTPTLSDSEVFFASSDDSIYCFFTATGHKEWSLQFPSDPSIAPPAYDNGDLYVVAGDTLYALNGHTGQTFWSRQFTQDITTPPTIGPDFIAVGTGDGTMTVFDDHGQVRWKDALGYPSYGDPLLAKNLLLVPNQHGILYALEPSSGKLDWEYVMPASLDKKGAVPTTTNINSAPILVDGVVYILSDDGTLSALSPTAIDTLPPVVTDMFPTPGSTVAGTGVYPTATVTDNGCGVNPSTVTMTLDGAALPDVIYSAGTRQALQNTTSANAPVPVTLSDGPHEMVLTATDWLGHTVTQSWGFFVDNTMDPQTETITQ